LKLRISLPGPASGRSVSPQRHQDTKEKDGFPEDDAKPGEFVFSILFNSVLNSGLGFLLDARRQFSLSLGGFVVDSPPESAKPPPFRW
jgi:hypothetical protein